MQKKSFQYNVVNFVIGLILSFFALICLYPLLYIIFASFSDPRQFVFHSGLLYKPIGFSLEAYKNTMQYKSIWQGYINTLLRCAVGILVNMLATTVAAYVCSRKDLYMYKAINVFVVFTMYFGGGLIPTFMVVKSLGLLDNRLALIIPGAINTYNMIILRSAIANVPGSLCESARIDGANDFTILYKIVIPLVKPTLAVLALYYIVGHWNSWFDAMVYLRSKEKYPLSLVIREILVGNELLEMQGVNMADTDHARRMVKYCVMVLSTMPILCVYPFLQKYFTSGVFIGSVKE